MRQEEFDRCAERGLGLPFAVTRSGNTMAARKGDTLKPRLNQVGTVIFETIDAVGRVRIDIIEIFGSTKSIVIKVNKDSLTGSLFETSSSAAIDQVYEMLNMLEASSEVIPVAKPEAPKVEIQVAEAEKVDVKKVEPEEIEAVKPEPPPKPTMTASLLEDIKAILKDYVGDFADRIYQNQIKAQRIKTTDFTEDDVRRLIFALGKAAGMIIGPSKGKELTNKLLGKLK